MYSPHPSASSGKNFTDPFKILPERELAAELLVARLRSQLTTNAIETVSTALNAGWIGADIAEEWLAEELAYINEPAPAEQVEAA